MVELMAKAEDRTPYTVVALQEADRMNGLTNEIKISLKELDLGLKVCISQILSKFKFVIFFLFLYKKIPYFNIGHNTNYIFLENRLAFGS